MVRRLLVLGATGSVGSHVVRRAGADGWQVVGASVSGRGGVALDVRDADAVRRLLDDVRPTAVVNATSAGGADVDRDAAVALAAELARRGVRLVHLSSDCVHGGREEPYGDEEPATPADWSYAQDKAAAEHGILALGSDAALVRSGMVLGDPEHGPPGRHDHFDQAYFADMVRQPVVVTDLAALVVALLAAGLVGTLHAAGPQAVSRLDLARGLARRAGADPASVRGTSLAGTGLARPAVLRLHTARAAALGVELRPVGDVVPL